MSPRAVYRHATPTIRHAPEGGVTHETFCVTAGCGDESGARGEQAAAQGWAPRRAGRTGHDVSRRFVTDHAEATRAE
ncbi:hypothetical protein RND61_18455 [Streptomyces sp. TRM76323]|uniref:DUF7848 domain-containing protein n=1 Tax=Streptomyces tamarix TaxID=3078565 RepID=A0ABU3QN42_9ACTN|nr:hypothetical protein [Streptomyces tamarix]MDT9684026.1 hypothetical protein [Streptomyces tamarix]